MIYFIILFKLIDIIYNEHKKKIKDAIYLNKY